MSEINTIESTPLHQRVRNLEAEFHALGMRIRYRRNRPAVVIREDRGDKVLDKLNVIERYLVGQTVWSAMMIADHFLFLAPDNPPKPPGEREAA